MHLGWTKKKICKSLLRMIRRIILGIRAFGYVSSACTLYTSTTKVGWILAKKKIKWNRKFEAPLSYSTGEYSVDNQWDRSLLGGSLVTVDQDKPTLCFSSFAMYIFDFLVCIRIDKQDRPGSTTGNPKPQDAGTVSRSFLLFHIIYQYRYQWNVDEQ